MRSQSEDSPQFAWFSWAANTMTVSTNAAGARELDSAKVPTDVHTYVRTYVHIRIRARVDCIVSGVVRSGTKQSSSDNQALGLVLRDGAGCEGHVAIRSSCYATSCSVLYLRVKVLVVQS